MKGTLNSRQRLLRAISGEEVDHFPCSFMSFAILRKRKQEDSRRDPRIITHLPYRVLNYYLDDRHNHIYVVKIETNGNHPTPKHLTEGEIDYAPPVWTPDDRFIDLCRA